MPSLHALLSASGSARWIHCTPSARLEERVEDRASAYAAEGTQAHSIAEQKLTNWKEGHPRKKVKCEVGEMDEATTDYKNYVLEIYNAEKKKDDLAELYIEMQVDLSHWIKEGFGTSDAVVVSNHTLHVIDLKYGAGVPVNAPRNTQLMIYAAGVMSELDCLYEFETVKMHIFQPRLDHISTWEISTQELADYMENIVKPAAEKAWNGEGEQQAGPWCLFCKVNQNCKARTDFYTKMDEQYERMNGMLLTDDQVAELLPELPGMIKWAKELQDFALEQALAGTQYKGYKVVEGRSLRKITNESGLSEVLQNKGYDYKDIMTTPKLQTITNLEKLVGKKEFATLSEGYIEKPQGKPTLVPESDKRPAMNSVTEDFKDGVN